MQSTTTTRRALLAGSAALAVALPAGAVASADPDAAIVALWAKHGDIMRRWQAIFRRGDVPGDKTPEQVAATAEADVLLAQAHAIEDEIVRMPAGSLMGVAIKLRVWRFNDGDLDLTRRDPVDLIPLSALLDIERIVGPVSSHWFVGDAEFVECREREAAAVAGTLSGSAPA